MNPLILLALIPPLLYAIGNYLDQYLVWKYGGEDDEDSSGILPLIMVSSLFSVLVLAILVPIFYNQIFVYSLSEIFTLIIAGILTIGAISLYLLALNEEDAVVVAPWWQLIPIASYILAFFVLHETVPHIQLLSGGIVLAGTMIMNIDVTRKGYFNRKVMLYMLSSTILWAMMNVLFKMVTVSEHFWASLIWQHVGILLFGLFWYAIKSNARTGFWQLLRESGPMMLAFNAFNELTTVVGDGLLQYAVLWGSVALVEVLHATQIVHVFWIGLAMTTLYPAMMRGKEISPITKNLRFIGLIVILLGIALLLRDIV